LDGHLIRAFSLARAVGRCMMGSDGVAVCSFENRAPVGLRPECAHVNLNGDPLLLQGQSFQSLQSLNPWPMLLLRLFFCKSIDTVSRCWGTLDIEANGCLADSGSSQPSSSWPRRQPAAASRAAASKSSRASECASAAVRQPCSVACQFLSLFQKNPRTRPPWTLHSGLA
jgi:hypothetical protein